MLTSVRNPLVKRIRQLHRAKGRREQGCFLLEGTNLVEAAHQQGYPLAAVCATERWQERHSDLWLRLSESVDRCEAVSEAVLGAIATTKNPDGVAAVAYREPWTPPANPRGDRPRSQVGLMLEKLQDPGNLGAIIRVAAATDVTGLWVSNDSVDLDHPKVLRASAGQWFRVPLQSTETLSETLQAQREQGVRIVSTSPAAECSYWDFDWRSPSLILLGNEGAGLSPELSAQADASVYIPQRSDVESLNVAMSAALLLYEVQRQYATAPSL
ncbi:MAG: RNA methyltransferase [Cyanobacteria bacterium P01_D01_bin.73]